MSYFCVGTKDDELRYHVWADNSQHAIRKIEAAIGGLPPQRAFALRISASQVPEGDDVMDEPLELEEARLLEYDN